MEIRDVLSRRSDLSTFLVHLTRDSEFGTARDALVSILETSHIKAQSMFGAAKSRLEARGIDLESQKCV